MRNIILSCMVICFLLVSCKKHETHNKHKKYDYQGILTDLSGKKLQQILLKSDNTIYDSMLPVGVLLWKYDGKDLELTSRLPVNGKIQVSKTRWKLISNSHNKYISSDKKIILIMKKISTTKNSTKKLE